MHNRQTTPTPLSRYATGTNPYTTLPVQHTMPKETEGKTDTHDFHNILHDRIDEYCSISSANIGDLPLNNESKDTYVPVQSEWKR